MDERHHLLHPGARVLDLGCRPGSWLQYAAKRVGAAGMLVGVDRTPLDVSIPRARIVVGDAFALPTGELLGELKAFDVVLSDMAPDTSGIRQVDQARSEALFERALDLAIELLAPGGHFVGKIFQGPDFPRLTDKARHAFTKVAMAKPASSRKQSIEQYVVGLSRRGE
jgi:23S rRNA (uridine2552-2'-O)-methyltransferase